MSQGASSGRPPAVESTAVEIPRNRLVSLDDVPRIVCPGCRGLMPDFSGGKFPRCATCTYGPSFSRSSVDAPRAVAAASKRSRLRVT
jgi:LSD1 subclass zinc finger protein